ncbi:MAG: TonB-dependent receptor [Bacteroidales bacterium]|nr:TonB-dependent receptor [Bacteroidales bacterium]
MKKKFFLFLAVFFLMSSIYAFQVKDSSIRGRVTDVSGNPLAGAGVSVENTFLGTICDPDGNYVFSGLKDGTYRLRFTFIGYEPQVHEVGLKGKAELDINLVPKPLITGEVIVNATRAGNRTPLAYSTVDGEIIRKHNVGQDIPFILGMTPSLVETSEAGNGIGYTSLRIRGTDASRINVTIDGIPLNDPESQQVFWVDLPDLASSADNIQIQRGAGTSSNGAGAFGATVSIQTKSSDNEPFAEISSSVGSFNTFKSSVSAGTGLLDGRFALEVRLSQLKSDGYIKRTGSDHRSSYISGVYNAGRSRVKANIILGEEHTGIGWWGVPKEMLTIDRRYNPAGEFTDEYGVSRFYDNESDNYRQNHYQLIYSLNVNDFINISTAFHYTRGEGYYEEYKYDREVSDYFPVPVINIGDTIITSTDLITRKWMSNDFYGFVYTLKYKRNRIETTFGGAANSYTGDHYGKIIWMRYSTLEKDYQWYFNSGTKREFSIFAKTTYALTDQLSVYGDLQYRQIFYRMKGFDDDQKDLGQKHNFSFFNPKGGLFWAISNNQDGYLSFSVAGREPTRADFKEAAGDSNATPEKERLYDTELGYSLRGAKFSVGANGYLMYYHDQLVPTGELSNTGYSIMTNVDRSYRLGIELKAGLKPANYLEWDFNLTLSRNKIADFTEYYTDYDIVSWDAEYKSKELGSVDIAYSPSITGTSDINFRIRKDLEIHFISKYVGSQYFDNTMSKERMIDPYFVNNVRISYEPAIRKIKGVEFQVLINNIFDAEYESNAYGGNWYEGGEEKSWSYYFPQAGTNVMFRAGIRF